MILIIRQFHIPKWILFLCILLTVSPIFLDDFNEYYIDDLAWFLLLFPCFIFTYYLGIKWGIGTAVLVNIYHVFWYLFGKYMKMEEIIDQEISLHVGVAIITFLCTLGVGFLSERLKEKQIELQNANDKLKTIALYDSLTGLPNRIYFNERLAYTLKNEETVTLLFIDLDGFKSVNDTYGHDEGDKLLQEVAKQFNQLVDKHTFVSRLGGDEFTVLLKEIDKEHSIHKANSILNMLQLNFKDISISASIGIAYHQQGDQPSTLLKKADTAMYKAKTGGKNSIVSL